MARTQFLAAGFWIGRTQFLPAGFWIGSNIIFGCRFLNRQWHSFCCRFLNRHWHYKTQQKLVLDWPILWENWNRNQPKITQKRDKDSLGPVPKHPSILIRAINTRGGREGGPFSFQRSICSNCMSSCMLPFLFHSQQKLNLSPSCSYLLRHEREKWWNLEEERAKTSSQDWLQPLLQQNHSFSRRKTKHD